MSYEGRVYMMTTSGDPSYPELLYSHPLNAGIDALAVWEAVQEGRAPVPAPDLFIKARKRIDVVWLDAMRTPVVSPTLRATLEAVAGKDLEFFPASVNGEPWWILHVATVLDAFHRSTTIDLFNTPQRIVWSRRALDDPVMFRVPHAPRMSWATEAVAAAFNASGCTGMKFFPRGEMM